MNNRVFDIFLLHLLRFEGGCVPARGEAMREAFERCREQAYSDHPADAGGATQMGITLKTFAAWRTQWLQRPRPTAADLRAMSYDEWRLIVEKLFWQRHSMHSITWECLALTAADSIFLCGAAGVRDIQRAFHLDPDGICGPRTLGALRHSCLTRESARATCADIVRRRLARLQELSAWKNFGRGWTLRAEALLEQLPRLDRAGT